MVRKTRRRGGMIRAIGKPLGKATLVLGESVGKDYLQNNSLKVVKGIYDDPSLATNPAFLATGKKPIPKAKIQIYNNENVYDSENVNPNIQKYTNSKTNLYENFGGRKYKKRKTKKNKK
jgi:hypothetical protein